eukprot:1391684-Amorphochlora_amoeboformis.AAC.2
MDASLVRKEAPLKKGSGAPITQEILSVIEKEPFGCPGCRKRFDTVDALIHHVNTVDHSRGSETPTLSCPVCGQKYTQKYRLQRHLYSHNMGEAFKCTQCRESFDTQDKLNQHLRFHLLNAFKCNVCGDCFPKIDQLNDHIKVHFGKKGKMDWMQRSDSHRTSSKQTSGFHVQAGKGKGLPQLIPNRRSFMMSHQKFKGYPQDVLQSKKRSYSQLNGGGGFDMMRKFNPRISSPVKF